MGHFSALSISQVYLILYGFYWFYTGLNGFLNFRPPPRGSDEFVLQIENLYKMKFLMPLVKALEILVGLLFILNYKTKLAFLVLAPILVGILFLQFLFNKNSKVLNLFLLLSYLAAGFCQNDWRLLWHAL